MDDKVAANTEYYKDIATSGRVHVPSVYCITIASNTDNLLDIISCNEMIFKHYKRNKLNVIGLASSKKNAVAIAIAIVLSVYKKTGSYDVRKIVGCDI